MFLIGNEKICNYQRPSDNLSEQHLEFQIRLVQQSNGGVDQDSRATHAIVLDSLLPEITSTRQRVLEQTLAKNEIQHSFCKLFLKCVEEKTRHQMTEVKANNGIAVELKPNIFLQETGSEKAR